MARKVAIQQKQGLGKLIRFDQAPKHIRGAR
jgi:hypothetical protein